MADYTQYGKDATKGIYKDVNDLLNGDATKTVTHKVVSDEKDPLQKDVAEALNSKLDALNRKINEMEIDNAISGLTYDDLIEAAFDESDIEGSEAVDDDGDVEVISTEADEDLDDEDLDDEDEDDDDSDEMGTITVDLPDDVDPSDVTVNIDGEEYSAGDDELEVNTDEDIDAPEITVDLPDHVDPSDVAVNIDGDNYIVDPDSVDDADDSDFDLVEDDDDVEDDEEDSDDIAEGFFRTGRYSRLFESDEGMDDDYEDDEDEYIGDEDADDGDLDDDEEIPEEGDDDIDEDDEEEDEGLEETVKMINHHLYYNGNLYEGDMVDDDEDYGDEDVDEDVDDSDLDDEDYDDEDVDDGDLDDEDYADEDDIDEEDEASDEIEEAINVLRRHGFIVESDGDFDMELGDMSDTASNALDDVRDALESEDEIIIDGGDGGVDDDGTIDTVSDPVNESEVAPVSSNGKNADEMQGDKLTDDEDADDDDSYEDEDEDSDEDVDDDSYEDEEPDEDTEVQTAEAMNILLNKYLGKKVSLNESAFAASCLIDKYLGECKGKKACKGKKKAKKNLVKGKKGRRKVAEGNYGLNAGMTIDTAGWNPYRTNTYLNSDKYFSRDGYTTKISAGNSKSNTMSGVAEGMTNRFTIYTDDLNQAIKPLAEVVTTRNNLPLAENVSNWNASKASAYIRKNAWKNPARANLALMRATHLYFVNEGTKPEDYQFPIATVIRGKVYAVPQAIEEAAALFASPIYTKKFNESTLTAIRGVIDFYMNKMGKRTAWQEGTCVNINEGTNLTMLIRKSVYDPYKIAEMEYIKDKERKAQELLRD